MAEHRIRRNRNASEVDQHQFGFLTAEYDRFWHPRDPRVIAAYICPLSTLFTHRALQPVRIPTRPSVGSKNGSNRKDGDMSRSGVALSGGVDHYLLWLSTWLIAGYRGYELIKEIGLHGMTGRPLLEMTGKFSNTLLGHLKCTQE